MSGALALVAGAASLAASAVAVQRLWLRRSAARRLDADAESTTTPVEAAQLPPLLPAAVAAAAAFAAARLAFAVSLPVALAIGFDVGALAWVVAATRRRSRDLRAEQQLGDALRLMTGALRAGASPNDALERAASQVGAPIGPKLRDASGRLRLGESAGDVLGTLGRETHLDSLRLFSQALAVQWRAGGSLQHTLSTVGTFVRDRVELQRRIESQVAPTRSSVLVLTGATAAVAFLAWSNDPTNVGLFVSSAFGRVAIAACFVLQGLSFLWMWRLARVEP
ncbi:MAG: type II secretion system F family protein [Myxococcota bacterium]